MPTALWGIASREGSLREVNVTTLDAAIAKVEGEHAEALRWFRDHAGQTVGWQEIKDHADLGARLVTQAKGIYKPHYTAFALSVRQTLDSPYADKEVVRRDDGSWVYPYFQENADPSQRDTEATNRGLIKCMEEGIPVGVLMQSKPKPGVEYNVLGLATVAEWRDGYFILAGVLRQGRIASQRPGDRRSV
jgi:putative restriction endonuclease